MAKSDIAQGKRFAAGGFGWDTGTSACAASQTLRLCKPSASFRLLWLGHSEILHLGGCGSIFGFHTQTFFRADAHAGAALDAGEGVDGPGSLGLVHNERGGWAALLADAAKDAKLNVVDYMAFGHRRVFVRL